MNNSMTKRIGHKLVILDQNTFLTIIKIAFPISLTNWNEKKEASTINSTSETILGFDFFFQIMGYKSEIM